MKNYILEPYTDNYYDFVYEVKKNAYIKYVEACWGTWNEKDQKEYYKKFIDTYKNSSYIIKWNNQAIGFYNDEELPDGSYEVGNICIISEYQGQGIGTEILKNKIEEHKNQNIKIQFFKQNPVGELYKRLGFIPNGETEFHYQMIKPTAIVQIPEEINMLIKKLINKLNLGTIIERPTRVMGGLLNRMYKVTTTTGIYAVKHLNPEVMKRKEAKNNHILAEKIANIAKNNHINCLPAKIMDGVALQELERNYFFIFDWFEGKAIHENEITIEHVKKVATLLAQLHNTDFKEVKDECVLGTESEEVNWDYYLERIENNEIKQLLVNQKEYLTELDKKATKARKEIENHLVVSHRDLDLPNILWDIHNNPTIIDWESAGVVNPCEELIETAWDWSGGQEYYDSTKMQCFINTYKENGGNIKDLKKAIDSNFKNKSGWLEYNLKRVCKLECLDEEEQKLGEKEVMRVIHEIKVFYDNMNKLIIGK